ncbi:hypothetical protein Dimus_035037 [Dionaea muscipula]
MAGVWPPYVIHEFVLGFHRHACYEGASSADPMLGEARCGELYTRRWDEPIVPSMIAFKMLLFGFRRKIGRAQARPWSVHGLGSVSSALMEARLKADLEIVRMPWARPRGRHPVLGFVWPPSCSPEVVCEGMGARFPELGSLVRSQSLGSSSSSCPSVVAMLDIRKGFGEPSSASETIHGSRSVLP